MATSSSQDDKKKIQEILERFFLDKFSHMVKPHTHPELDRTHKRKRNDDPHQVILFQKGCKDCESNCLREILVPRLVDAATKNLMPLAGLRPWEGDHCFEAQFSRDMSRAIDFADCIDQTVTNDNDETITAMKPALLEIGAAVPSMQPFIYWLYHSWDDETDKCVTCSYAWTEDIPHEGVGCPTCGLPPPPPRPPTPQECPTCGKGLEKGNVLCGGKGP